MRSEPKASILKTTHKKLRGFRPVVVVLFVTHPSPSSGIDG